MVSIIVPVYKVEKYIHRCVDSILRQTFADLELILVDDGSPDNCGSICDEYATKDSRVMVIHQKNGGLSAARNAGLKVASGKYLSFVDSDDCIHEKMYESMIRVIQEEDVDFVKSNFAVFSNGIPSCRVVAPNVTIYSPVEALRDFMCTEYSNEKHMKSTVCDTIYKRSVFFDGESLAIQFPDGKINEDTYIFPELIFRARKIAHIEAAFYFYFVNENGITHSAVSEREINSCNLWEHVYSVISQYTDDYRTQCANNSVGRYINVLRRLHSSEIRHRYFDKVRQAMYADRFDLMPYVDDPRIRRSLGLIKAYPVYRIVKFMLGNRIY
jgi:glycosyltransferase involved in cell wall biosynthesis